MSEVVLVVQTISSLAFVALGVAVGIVWWRNRGRAEGRLAVALILLASVAAIGRIQGFFPPPVAAGLGAVSVVAFVLSGYMVLLFRDAFLPLSRASWRAATGLLVLSALAGLALTFTKSSGWVGTLLVLEVVLAWAIFTGEPIGRFWLASRGLPRVQRARMRALSYGFALLIVVLIGSVLGGSASQNPIVAIFIQILAITSIPFIYLSFAPPTLLRSYWRLKEETALRQSMQELLLFTPTQQALADKALPWAMRLVGGHGALIAGGGGRVMSVSGMSQELVDRLLAGHQAIDAARIASLERSVVAVVPLHLNDADGLLCVEAGPYTPVFGTDELGRLESYAVAVTAGLERTKVTERMAAIERNKSQFLNLASHELRTPVSVIRGYVAMLENGMCGELNELGQTAAHTMKAKVIEINELIEQMMESARLEDGRLALRRQPVDLRSILSEAVETVRPLIDAVHTVELKEPELPVMVEADRDRVLSILTNLISNALKYSPHGGLVLCESSRRMGWAQVSVSDPGVGIATEDFPLLFTRFGRISNSETQHLPGTGLGLFLAQQLAHLHGGEITVQSRVGHGSTFTLKLPERLTIELVPGDGQRIGGSALKDRSA